MGRFQGRGQSSRRGARGCRTISKMLKLIYLNTCDSIHLEILNKWWRNWSDSSNYWRPIQAPPLSSWLTRLCFLSGDTRPNSRIDGEILYLLYGDIFLECCCTRFVGVAKECGRRPKETTNRASQMSKCISVIRCPWDIAMDIAEGTWCRSDCSWLFPIRWSPHSVHEGVQ